MPISSSQSTALLLNGEQIKSIPRLAQCDLSAAHCEIVNSIHFQAADVYLFSTLCHEGFGMTLIEALHCGNYCIASALGGVPEVLQYGKLGMLLDAPHFVNSWTTAIENYLENPTSFEIPRELYSTHSWNAGMNTLIDNAKFAIDHK